MVVAMSPPPLPPSPAGRGVTPTKVPYKSHNAPISELFVYLQCLCFYCLISKTFKIMGKAPNGLGKFSGKVGGVVFAISNGEQIVRAYQPVVSNPKSSGQQIQRAKGNLAGRVSQIVPYQILQGLGDNRRARRSRFLRLILNAITTSADAATPNVINATLSDDDFIYSEGSLTPTIGVTTASATMNTISITLSRLAGVATAEWEKSGALVVALVKSVSGVYEQVYYRFCSNEDFDSNTLTISFSHLSEGAYNVSVYVAPFATIDGTSLRTKTEELIGDATSLNAALISNPSAIPLTWGRSVRQTTANFTPAGKDADENYAPCSKAKK